MPNPTGLIFDLDSFAVHDGPGIRLAVYFKGCALSCQWCHSPESRRTTPELIFMRDRCVLCGCCAAVCTHGVHRIADGAGHTLDRDRCVACGRCVERCPCGALAIKGHTVPASHIVARATRLKPFFKHSGGGVTLTGGEVTLQADFAAAVLNGCRRKGIHTAIETCGACDWSVLEALLPHTDLVLYDLKLIDDDEHRRWTGASNRAILDNARRLACAGRLGLTPGAPRSPGEAALGPTVQVRIPLIPGVTDTDANLRGLFAFMRDAALPRVEFLPFNASAGAKYEWLGETCAVTGEPQDAARLAEIVALAREHGLAANVS